MLTWYIAQVDTETAEQMGTGVSRPAIQAFAVSVIRTTGQVAYERLLQDLKNNAPQCDVFSSTDIAQYPALKKRGALAEFKPDGADGAAARGESDRRSRVLLPVGADRAFADLQFRES